MVRSERMSEEMNERRSEGMKERSSKKFPTDFDFVCEAVVQHVEFAVVP